MCGLCGVILGRSRRSQRELDRLTDAFTRLLLLSEHRGPHATGVACIRDDGDISVAKRPLGARSFVNSSAYVSWLADIAQGTTYLMGHTRWPTRGSIYNQNNNHPLLAEVGGGYVALTHNGTISDAPRHFRRLKLQRTAEVDSELLVRLAQRNSGDEGLALDRYLSDLQALSGRMSATMVVTNKPDEVILLKGNMPLEIRHHPRRKVIAYASEASILDDALRGDGWIDIPIVAGEGLVIDCTELSLIRRFQFEFEGVKSPPITTAYVE